MCIKSKPPFIDSITKEYKGENGNVAPKSKRAKRVQEILEKVDSVLDKRDKTWYNLSKNIKTEVLIY